MFSGSEAGSYLRLIDFVHHSTLGLRVMTKKKKSTHNVIVAVQSSQKVFIPPPSTFVYVYVGNHHDDKVDSDQ